MDNAYCIDYHQTNSFSKLFLDYIDEKKELSSFYNFTPSLSSIKAAINGKEKENINRALLIERLNFQYSKINLKDTVQQNINALQSSNTFTITTGHQLAIFTGEWYFIFKIMTAIKMAKDAKKMFPEYNFVPVFWMASEDHDFEEINHINLAGHKFEWKTNSGGPTGRIKVDSISTVVDSLNHFIENRPHANKLIDLYKTAYKKGNNLAEATRVLVNELFADDGLVIIDADDVDLKKSWIPTIKKEIFEQKSFDACNTLTESLEKLNYSSQIHPREINMFYILDGFRERIISENNKYKTNDGKYEFTKEEMELEISNHPERFSPNVVLRPLYQESILPNLCYIGGPGEIAYWLQLKSVFEIYNVQYPIVAWRNSFMVLNKTDLIKWEKLGLAVKDFFKSIQVLEDEYVTKHQTEKINLLEEEKLLKNYISQLKSKAISVDQNLEYSLKGTEQRILRMMERVEHKIWKAEKSKYKSALVQIENLKTTYFPNGKLQERNDNFSLWYANCGIEGMKMLQKETEVLSKHIKAVLF